MDKPTYVGYRPVMTTTPDDPDVQYDETDLPEEPEPESDGPAQPDSGGAAEADESAI
jgi:hypothetical protein